VSVANDASESINGAQSSTVAKGRTTSVGEDDALKVGKNFTINADESISLVTGDASITMKKDGTIEIKGKDITVQGSGKINLTADGDIVMTASNIHQN
jgi:type VI secretion system secreted protein VgrG